MNADTSYRLFSTLANTACFGYVLTLKIVDHRSYLLPEVGKSVGISTTVLCTAVYFALLYISVLDRIRIVGIYEASTLVQNKEQFGVNDITVRIGQFGIEEEVRDEIKSRILDGIQLFGREETLKNLITQYNVCVENEKFYEKIAWQIGSIFVPLSLTLGTLSLTQQVPHSSFPAVGGCILFLTWVFLFGRFRTTIRLYRDCARLLEGLLGFFAVTYVYDYCFEKYGRVVRVWPFLVTMAGLYFNFAVLLVL